MLCFPNGKINLGLSVINKRPDGFHNIETIMVPVSLCDVLEIIPSSNGSNSFHLSGVNLDGNSEDNLVMKAYQLLKRDFKLSPVSIHLHKNIPSGAGLGGGSADAAFTIILLNELFNLQLKLSQLEDYARKIGSDCPFFIRNKAALAYEKGDQFSPISLHLENYYLVIVKPDIHISTPQAYSRVKPYPKEIPLENIISLPIEKWKSSLINDFETEIFKPYPEIKKIKNNLYDAGAVYASLTGSGAAVFGIFENKTHLKMRFMNCFVWEGKFSF
ncbi:MAG: 4-(cytidine 5'-diphospho)-2-C-methyl-D-erythritol kinase [Bacteroidales bacterium]